MKKNNGYCNNYFINIPDTYRDGMQTHQHKIDPRESILPDISCSLTSLLTEPQRLSVDYSYPEISSFFCTDIFQINVNCFN